MSVTRALDFTFRASSLLAVMATPFLLVNWCRYSLALQRAPFPNSRALVPFPTKTVLFFVMPIAVTFIIANVATASSQQKVVDFLHRPDATQFTVLVNGRPVANGSEIVQSLRGVSAWYWAHHSHPTKRVHVQINSPSGQLSLELGRDSGRPQEYWVFDPAGTITNLNEIGRITTHLFDDY